MAGLDGDSSVPPLLPHASLLRDFGLFSQAPLRAIEALQTFARQDRLLGLISGRRDGAVRWSLDPGTPPGLLMVHQGQPERAGPRWPCGGLVLGTATPPLPHPSPLSLALLGGGFWPQGWASPSPSSTGWTGATPSSVSPHRGGHGATSEPSRPRRQPCQPPGHPAHPARRALALAAGRARLAPAPGRAAVGAQLPAAG